MIALFLAEIHEDISINADHLVILHENKRYHSCVDSYMKSSVYVRKTRRILHSLLTFISAKPFVPKLIIKSAFLYPADILAVLITKSLPLLILRKDGAYLHSVL